MSTADRGLTSETESEFMSHLSEHAVIYKAEAGLPYEKIMLFTGEGLVFQRSNAWRLARSNRKLLAPMKSGLFETGSIFLLVNLYNLIAYKDMGSTTLIGSLSIH